MRTYQRTVTAMATGTTVSLRAEAGTAVLPGPAGPENVPVWGFRNVAGLGPAQVPGPVIEAMEGGKVIVDLGNALAEPVSIAFPGQDIAPQPVKDAAGKFLSYTNPAEPGGQVTYTFWADRPGTFLYESATSPERQVQMGLYGALIVRPWNFAPDRPVGRIAYGWGTEYDVEKILVLGDVDTAMHNSIAAGEPFDMRGYAPDQWTINGRAYPDTASLLVRAGEDVLLRCLNAGFQPHSLCFGGLTARVIGADGYPLVKPQLDASYRKTTLTIGAGQTFDVILRPRAEGEYILYDRALEHAVGGGAFPGGMIARIEVR